MSPGLVPWLNEYGIKVLMLYEANDVQEAMMVHNRILILVSPFQQPRKQV